MNVTILLFAALKDRAGGPTVTVDLPESPTVGDLKAALAHACPALAPWLPTLRVAIDSEYARDDAQPIPPGAELAAIPPVSGGSSRGCPSR